MTKSYYVSGNRKSGYRATEQGKKTAVITGRTQAEVIKQAREDIAKNGGGELRVQDTHGQFRAESTVRPKKSKLFGL